MNPNTSTEYFAMLKSRFLLVCLLLASCKSNQQNKLKDVVEPDSQHAFLGSGWLADNPVRLLPGCLQDSSYRISQPNRADFLSGTQMSSQDVSNYLVRISPFEDRDAKSIDAEIAAHMTSSYSSSLYMLIRRSNGEIAFEGATPRLGPAAAELYRAGQSQPDEGFAAAWRNLCGDGYVRLMGYGDLVLYTMKATWPDSNINRKFLASFASETTDEMLKSLLDFHRQYPVNGEISVIISTRGGSFQAAIDRYKTGLHCKIGSKDSPEDLQKNVRPCFESYHEIGSLLKSDVHNKDLLDIANIPAATADRALLSRLTSYFAADIKEVSSGPFQLPDGTILSNFRGPEVMNDNLYTLKINREMLLSLRKSALEKVVALDDVARVSGENAENSRIRAEVQSRLAALDVAYHDCTVAKGYRDVAKCNAGLDYWLSPASKTDHPMTGTVDTLLPSSSAFDYCQALQLRYRHSKVLQGNTPRYQDERAFMIIANQIFDAKVPLRGGETLNLADVEANGKTDSVAELNCEAVQEGFLKATAVAVTAASHVLPSLTPLNSIPNLENLELIYQGSSLFPGRIAENRKLGTLNLSNNTLRTWNVPMPNLTALNLSNNILNAFEVPAIPDSAPQLQTLDLSGNVNLVKLDITGLKFLRELKLTQNSKIWLQGLEPLRSRGAEYVPLVVKLSATPNNQKFCDIPAERVTFVCE